MLATLQCLLANQFEASLCTLAHCVRRCPAATWDAAVAKYPFCQTAFHVLFFTDYYLEQDPRSLRAQAFHVTNSDLFGDYEQLSPREPTSLYSKQQIEMYLAFCRTKALNMTTTETADSLTAPCGFDGKHFSRAELHVYNIRHIQHHAAQLILRLRLDSNIEVPWIGTGWRDP